jgi:hypothetical protein
MERRSLVMNSGQWEEVSGRARAVLNYGIVQKEWLQTSRMARFIAAIPFIAGCGKAPSTSFSHLIIYLISLDESARDIFFHSPQDDTDIYSRLQPLSCYPGGNPEILQTCRDLLALCMISNYRRDAEEDTAVGKYNPIANGIWDGDALIKELTEKINKTIIPEISEFYTVQEALRGAWQD